MQTISIHALSGAALDWAIAQTIHLNLRHDPMGFKTGSEAGWWIWDNANPRFPRYARIGTDFSPSTQWAFAGPLMDDINVSSLAPINEPLWRSMVNPGFECSGETRLIAAMRCYLLHQVGDVISIPEELL